MALSVDPATPLAAAAAHAGVSLRTAERRFFAETGMPLGRWRQQARLLAGVRSLASGGDVTESALAAGYESTSAFIAAFRKVFGTTPGQYARAGRARDEGTGSAADA